MASPFFIKKAQMAIIRRAIASGQTRCPKCATPITSMPDEPDDLLVCEACGASGSFPEWSQRERATADEEREWTEKPANSRIERLGTPPGECEWRIPASGKSGGLLGFGIVWCLITGVISSAFLLGDPEGSSSGDSTPTGFLLAFFAAFWAVGIGMLYSGLRAKHASHLLIIGLSKITLRRNFFGRVKERSIPREGLVAVSLKEFYRRNYAPVYGIEIRSPGGKLRFGSALDDAEKAWLVNDLNSVIAPIAEVREEPAARGRPLAHFSFPIPRSGALSWAAALPAIAIGALFLAIGIFFIPGPESIPAARPSAPVGIRIFEGVFNFLTGTFAIIWNTISALILISGLVMLMRKIRLGNQEIRLEGTASEIAIRSLSHGRILKQTTFPRSQVTRIRAYHTGHNNGTPMKGIELQASGKARTLTRWADGAEVEHFVAEVRAALGCS
jgi:hypothetical protein